MTNKFKEAVLDNIRINGVSLFAGQKIDGLREIEQYYEAVKDNNFKGFKMGYKAIRSKDIEDVEYAMCLWLSEHHKHPVYLMHERTEIVLPEDEWNTDINDRDGINPDEFIRVIPFNDSWLDYR